MKLRTRFVVVMAGFVFALTCLASLIAGQLFLVRANSLEKELMRNAFERGRLELEKERDRLGSLADDWASWDDTYAFMSDTNRHYLDSNLVDGMFKSLGLSLMAFFDFQGRPFYAKGFDLAGNRETPPPEHLWNRLLATESLTHFSDPAASALGFLAVHGDVWLVASRPILTSQDEGPARGVLLMARRVSGNTDCKGSLRGDIAVYPCENPSPGRKIVIRYAQLRTVKGNGWIPDLEGRNTVMVECTIDRKVFIHGLISQFYLTGWILLCGAGTGLFSFWVVDRWILRELAQSLESLKSGINALAVDAPLPSSLKTSRRDEMGELANMLYTMLESRAQFRQLAEKRRAELIQAQKLSAMGSLVAGVAHEVNNPNTVISLNLAALRRRVDDLFAAGGSPAGGGMPIRREIDELVSEMRDASNRIAALVASLKTFTRPAAPALVEPVSLNTVIRNACDLLRHAIEKNRCALRLALADDLPPIEGNPQQLTQVMVNLIQNAAQASTRPGSVIEVASARDPAANRVRVTVRDEGAGIAPENIERVFEPFFTTRREQGGTGLGLSISSEIIHAHRGRIDVRSPLGQGAVFTIELPAKKEGGHAS